MPIKKQNSSAAFTLIEIVIAISILAIIMSITYTALIQIVRSKNILDDRRDINAISYTVLNRMVREFQLAYSGIGLLPPSNKKDSPQLASNINLIGEEKTLSNGKRGDNIQFLALEGGQYLPDGGSHSGLVQLTYRVEENPDSKSSENPIYLLVREETPVIRPNDKAFSKTMIFPVIDRLVSLEYRYFDSENQTWLESWEQDKNFGLPSQVELRLQVLSPKEEIHTFVTNVPLRSINAVPQG